MIRAVLLLFVLALPQNHAFFVTPVPRAITTTRWAVEPSTESLSKEGVVELVDESTEVAAADAAATTNTNQPSGPLFISQGEILDESLSPDLSDPKQARVIIYTILSLLPVLFLIPFMLSREFLPLEDLPPVPM